MASKLAVVAASAVSVVSASTPIKRAAIAQLRSTSCKVTNLRHVAQCAGLAKREEACMLFLPECFGFLGDSSRQTLENAESLTVRQDELNDDAAGFYNALADIVRDASSTEEGGFQPLEWEHTPQNQNTRNILLGGIRRIAKESGLWISGGGLHEQDAPSSPGSQAPRVYNTHIIVNSDGELVSTYRKIHLFDVSIPSQNIHLVESKTTAPGTDLVVCDSPLGILGLSTCYDMRFPEQYTQLRALGAQILLAPSAFTVPTGRAHWHTLLRCRAIETQCYVLAAAQFGVHNEKRSSYGHSIAIDPWGTVLADAGGVDGRGTLEAPAEGVTGASDDAIVTPSVVICDIDLDSMESIRTRMPIEKHRSNASFS